MKKPSEIRSIFGAPENLSRQIFFYLGNVNFMLDFKDFFEGSLQITLQNKIRPQGRE